MHTLPQHNPLIIDRKDIGVFVADHVSAMLAYWDKNGICRFANNAYIEWFGRGRADMVDKISISELLGPALYEKNRPYIEGVLKGIPQFFERELVLPNGQIRQTTASYYPDEHNGEVRGFFVHVADVTALKRAEELQLKYVALQAKNHELEQFVYVASHDLQEPLRTISGLTELMQKRLAGKIDADTDKYLHYLSSSALRMRELIKGLLDYALLGNDLNLEPVDTNKVVEAVIQNLLAKINQASATVKITEPLPVVNGYKSELQALFQNLIGNAIKFRKKDLEPVVNISAQKVNNTWQFKIEDNGIGMDEKNLDKIFGIFKRLHNRSEIPGNGIGLAHCKKIAEVHHGKIWAEAALGVGSTFYFTLNT